MSDARKPVKRSSRAERAGAGFGMPEGATSPQEASTAVREAVVTAAALGFDEGVDYVLSILQDLHEVAVKLKVQEQINHDRGAGAYARSISDLHN